MDAARPWRSPSRRAPGKVARSLVLRSVLIPVVARAGRVLGVAVAIAAITFLLLRLLRPESFADAHPLLVELLVHLERVFLHLDFGTSRNPPFPEVTDLLAQGLPADLSLVGGAFVLGIGGGCLAGALCALYPRSLPTRLLEGVGSLLLVAPVYFVGLVVILLFAPVIGVLAQTPLVDVGTYVPLSEGPGDWARGLLVPWLVTAAPLWAICLRLMYSSLREVLDADFIRTARGKGLSEWRVMTRHAMPAAAAPVVTLSGAYTPILVGNALLVEQVFNVPGIFRATTGAVSSGDFEVLQGLIVVGAMLVVATNVVADVVLAWIDPRTR